MYTAAVHLLTDHQHAGPRRCAGCLASLYNATSSPVAYASALAALPPPASTAAVQAAAAAAAMQLAAFPDLAAEQQIAPNATCGAPLPTALRDLQFS